MSPLRTEIGKLASLAVPVIGTQLATMLTGTVDTLMVAHIDVASLAASAIANAWIWGVLLAGQGLIQGMDPLVTHAHGAGDGRAAGQALQRGLVLAALTSAPLALLFWKTESLLLLAGQDGALARAAHAYTVVQIPSIPFLLTFAALRQYLQGRELVRPAMWVALAANAFNVLANWVLIFGHLGAPALGLVGAGIATAATRVFLLAGLCIWVWGFDSLRGAWLPWSRDALAPRAIARLLALGMPIALHMSLEIFAFSAATLLAGRIGAAAVAAHTIVLNLAALAFMMPLGISQGAVTRVGNLLGARRPEAAQRAAWVAIAMGGGLMAISAVAFVVLRRSLALPFTSDPAVVALCASILPIAALFQISDGVQVVGCGILRGMGRTRPAAWFNLLGYWLLGLPLGAWLGLRAGLGLAGVWWGLCLGLTFVAVSLVAWVARLGPRHATAIGWQEEPAPREPAPALPPRV